MNAEQCINTKRLEETFLAFTGIDSESGEEKDFCEYLVQVFSELGAECTVEKIHPEVSSNTGNLIVRVKGTCKGRRPLLFSCHMDTVQPGKGIQAKVLEDRIVSSGETILAADDKAGIACLVEAVRVIREKKTEHGDIEMVFSVREETGLLGARYTELEKINAKEAFILDSSDPPGSVVVKGVAQELVNVTVIGKTAHAGVAPEEGISALLVAAKALSKMKLLRVSPETTANFSRIEGGGATNIVTGKVRLFGEARSLDVRQLDEQVAHMKDCFEQAAAEAGAEVIFEHRRTYPGFNVAKDSKILELVRKAVRQAALPYAEVSSGGGSDTNIYNMRSLCSVTLGIGEMKPHSKEEYILRKDLRDVTKLVLSLIDVYSREEVGN